MGQLERESGRRKRRADISAIILGTVQAAGIISLALVAPNALSGMQKLGFIPSPRQAEYLRSAQKRLIAQGLLAYEHGKIRLTRKGEAALRAHEISTFNIKPPRTRDKRWRMLIFDVPERKRSSRTRLTGALRTAGFIRLQDSVWVHPYECEDMVQLIKTELGVSHDVLYIIADTIENDRRLRDHFGL